MIHRVSTAFLATLRFDVAAVALGCSLLGGCAAVDPSPFEDFAAATSEIHQSADAVLEYDYDLSHERFLVEIEADDRARIGSVIQALTIERSEVPGDDFGWKSENEPLFLQVRRFRHAVNELNEAMVDYATLLVKLAGPTGIDDEELQNFAGELNGNVQSAAAALTPDPQEDQLAGLSTIAAGAFQQYINSRQRSHLAQALEANQSWVKQVSELGQEAARNMAAALWAEMNPLLDQFASVVQEPSAEKRREVAEAQMQLNEQFLDMLAAARTLDAAYAKLPDAHQALAEGLETGSFNRRSIRQMYEYGKRLERLNEQLMGGDGG